VLIIWRCFVPEFVDIESPILVKRSFESRPFLQEPQTLYSVLISTWTFCFSHSAPTACPQPLLVRSLQLVEVWPYAEEEEEEELGLLGCIRSSAFQDTAYSIKHCLHVLVIYRRERTADGVDLVLTSADGISETVGTLLAWLSTAESYLSESKCMLGDVDTVGVLMQQHQACLILSFFLDTRTLHLNLSKQRLQTGFHRLTELLISYLNFIM